MQRLVEFFRTDLADQMADAGHKVNGEVESLERLICDQFAIAVGDRRDGM